MKTKKFTLLVIVFVLCGEAYSQIADINTYLRPIVTEFQKEWPNNQTMNLVFHGHSVPTGYFKTPDVRTLEAYPYLTLVNLKGLYPYAVINTITTSIGGEQSEKGETRFTSEVLTMLPKVVFIDYAINDRGIGLERARAAWIKMIESAINYGCKVMLMTPTPVSNEDLLDEQSPLALHAAQIRELAGIYHVGLVDSFKAFQDLANTGTDLSNYYAQPVHVNEKGHLVVAEEIKKWFDFSQASVSSSYHYDFETNDETTTFDKINNAEATFLGSSILADDVRGNVLSLPTANASLKIIENPFNKINYSISFWIKLKVEEFNKYAFYFTEQSGKHLLGLTKENWFTPKQFCFYNQGVSGICGTAEKLNTEVWTHLVIVGDGATATMYQNGTKRSTRTLALSELNFTDFYVGTPTNSSAIFYMDDLMFFPNMLTDQEIIDLYNTQKADGTLTSKLIDGSKPVSYYPNPVRVNENLEIDLSGFKSLEPINFSVSTLEGKMIFSKIISIEEQKGFKYKVTQEGVLILTLSNGNQKESFKIIVK
ncbi:LamG-like jellyroll fold domain-containing protein [Aestuariibaculum suncheonense]|uniref:T9SS type A sorting domain-containing protein n=1 Tax=Aestuariibaculum suncheonense TaxID=1028745 RepID=A0A8J6UG74_9FLAO|nr:LamG-like jellyroll fold domain-containing protein [Aestuariibaculum suncheonense]MBD0834809.1 T9SS type A sorting domain-containing protein [Aestuariibaculum suncheonense]